MSPESKRLCGPICVKQNGETFTQSPDRAGDQRRARSRMHKSLCISVGPMNPPARGCLRLELAVLCRRQAVQEIRRVYGFARVFKSLSLRNYVRSLGRNWSGLCRLQVPAYFADSHTCPKTDLPGSRRHLSKGQQAMAVAFAYPEPEKGGRGKKGKAAETSGFSQRRLGQARQILSHSRALGTGGARRPQSISRKRRLDRAGLSDLPECCDCMPSI
jgi:hypothetical protein